MSDTDHRQEEECHRQRLLHVLAAAADAMGVTVIGEPAVGWRLRTIGARVASTASVRWLRVVGEPPGHLLGRWWTGNVTAPAVVRRPHVRAEWETSADGWRMRAELMELVPEQPCSPTAAAREALSLGDRWWQDLRRGLDALASEPVDRALEDQPERFAAALHDAWPEVVVHVEHWVPAHRDLHWGNLTAPVGWWLDWEGWDLAPAGFDAASLYLHSLAVPSLAVRVHDELGNLLDTPDGRLAQLYWADGMFRRGDRDDPAVNRAVCAHVDRLLGRVPSARR